MDKLKTSLAGRSNTDLNGQLLILDWGSEKAMEIVREIYKRRRHRKVFKKLSLET